MPHSHNHVPVCTHEELKFCAKCNVPYCVKCGKEWYEGTNAWLGPYLGNSNKPQITSNGKLTKPDVTYTATCSH